jgi:hypothetical protein
MKHYLTPNPGLGQAKPQPQPEGNIVDSEHYKLDITLKQFRKGEYLFKIAKYIPEIGWREQNFFLSDRELELIRNIVNGS